MNLKNTLGTALVTPFTEQGGLDYIALERLLRMQQDAEVDYVVVLGTTGEKATLDAEEIESIQDNIIAYYNTQVPLVIGFGGGSVLDLAKFAAFVGKQQYICLPTTLSNDSLTSPVAVLVTEGKARRSFHCEIPDAIFVVERKPLCIFG